MVTVVKLLIFFFYGNQFPKTCHENNSLVKTPCFHTVTHGRLRLNKKKPVSCFAISGDSPYE